MNRVIFICFLYLYNLKYTTMKRVLLSFFLLSATVGVSSLQHASAYAAPAPVTVAAFTAKVNLMDTQIGAGNITAAQATWNEIHDMMLSVLGVSKSSINTAATPAIAASHRTILENQTVIYQAVWNLKPNLAANRVALHTKLGEFAATIY
jgi:hypothetical protein